MKRLLALIVTVSALAAAPAAAQVGGATYSGFHNAGRGGPVKFKLDGAGSRVVSYSFSEVVGDSCTFVAGGDEGVWEGASLSGGGAFSYRLFDAIVIDGDFDGRTAAGTLRLRNRQPCDSGEVRWSAATGGEDPPPVPGLQLPPPAPAPAPSPGTTKRRTVLASIIAGRRGGRIIGKVQSESRSCHARRKLTLKYGKRIVARTTTRSDGRFTLRRSARTRNRLVRVYAATSREPTLTCGAVKSVRFRG